MTLSAVLQPVRPTLLLFFCVWKKAYMPIDANLVSNLERQIKQTTGELRVHSTSYDKGSCFAMA